MRCWRRRSMWPMTCSSLNVRAGKFMLVPGPRSPVPSPGSRVPGQKKKIHIGIRYPGPGTRDRGPYLSAFHHRVRERGEAEPAEACREPAEDVGREVDAEIDARE